MSSPQHNEAAITTPRFKQISFPSFFQHFAWVWMRLYMVIFCRFNIRGKENIRHTKTNVIIAANHTSELDPIIIVASLPFFSAILPLSYVSRSKDFYAQTPYGSIYGGRFFEMMGAYPVYPNLGNYEKSLGHQLDAIKGGMSIGIFPVGKIHSLTEISHARGGVSYLALKTGLPIIPMRIDGLSNRKLKDFFTFKCRVTVTFGKPIYAKDIFDKYAVTGAKENHAVCEKAAVVIMNKIAKL